MVVLDANVWVASLLGDEPKHIDSDRWLYDWLSNERSLVVPALFVVEVGSAVARRRRSALEGNIAIARVETEPLLDIRDQSPHLWSSGARHAANLQIRAADAIYVALAADLGLPLVTWDQEILDRAADVIDVRTPDQMPT